MFENSTKKYSQNFSFSDAEDLITSTQGKIVVFTDGQQELGAFGGLLKYVRSASGKAALFLICAGALSPGKRASLEDITGDGQLIIADGEKATAARIGQFLQH